METLRSGYRERFIKDLKENELVAISGVVVSRDDNGVFTDDGSGQIMVAISNDIEQGRYARIFGRAVMYEGNLQIIGDILQDLNDIDKQLHNRLKKLLSL